MKRFTLAALLCATVFILGAGVAQARWVPDPVNWHREHWSTIYPTGVNNADTTWTTGGDAKVDTSATFTLSDAENPGANYWGKTSTTADTVVVAYITIYGDSSVANTVNFKACTVAIQGNWGTYKPGWQTMKTYTCAMADAQKAWVIPVFIDPTLGITSMDYNNSALGGASLVNQNGWFFGQSLRLIFTGTTSTTVPAMRITVTKFRPPGSNTTGGGTSNF